MIQFVKSHLIRCASNFSHSGANRPGLTNMAQLMKPKHKILLTKKLVLISLTLCQVLNGWLVSKAIGQTPNDYPTEEQSIILKWLGNAGWEIRYRKTIILIDPFLTRREAVLGAEWKHQRRVSLEGHYWSGLSLPDIATLTISAICPSSQRDSALK